jgi:two-component system, cell cycle response regulator DivK
MLTRRLVRRGFGVIAAGDGLAALAQVQREEPDLILMDLSLPEMDGLEATRRLKDSLATRHIPIIALTAHAMRSDLERAVRAGCDEFETKPVDFPKLLAKIRNLVSVVVGPTHG